MNPEYKKIALQKNWKNRIETLTEMFNRLIDEASGLDDPYFAVVYTEKVAQFLSRAALDLKQIKRQRAGDDLLNNALNGSDP